MTDNMLNMVDNSEYTDSYIIDLSMYNPEWCPYRDDNMADSINFLIATCKKQQEKIEDLERQVNSLELNTRDK